MVLIPLITLSLYMFFNIDPDNRQNFSSVVINCKEFKIKTSNILITFEKHLSNLSYLLDFLRPFIVSTAWEGRRGVSSSFGVIVS